MHSPICCCLESSLLQIVFVAVTHAAVRGSNRQGVWSLQDGAIFVKRESLLAEDVEQELMELWSNVEKERAARQELTSIRVTRQAGHRPTDAADQFAIDQQAAAGMSISTGFAYEATPLKDSSVDATAGNTGKGLCDKGEHAAQPVNSEAQVTYASAESHQMPDCHGSSMAGEDAHIHSKKPGVEKGCRETGVFLVMGPSWIWVEPPMMYMLLRAVARVSLSYALQDGVRSSRYICRLPWMQWSSAHLLYSSCRQAAGMQTC